jgi:hypothetical protein
MKKIAYFGLLLLLLAFLYYETQSPTNDNSEPENTTQVLGPSVDSIPPIEEKTSRDGNNHTNRSITTTNDTNDVVESKTSLKENPEETKSVSTEDRGHTNQMTVKKVSGSTISISQSIGEESSQEVHITNASGGTIVVQNGEIKKNTADTAVIIINGDTVR